MTAKTMKKKTKRSVKKSVNRTRARDSAEDIISMILEDHKPLKSLIKIMKNSDKYDLTERQNAFEEFCPRLITHAKPEEQTMYVYMKGEEELREGGFEGDVEHQLADQMIEEAKRTEDEDLWSARVKVLAELVEHHIKEEEEELLPDFRRHSEKAERQKMGEQFLRLKSRIEAKGGVDSPSEDTIDEQTSPRQKSKSSERRTTLQ